MFLATRTLLSLTLCLAVASHSYDEPLKAEVKNLLSTSDECKDSVSVLYRDDGAVDVIFRDLAASRSHSLPFLKCQLTGELIVPNGYRLTSSQFVDAQFSAHLSMPGDQGGGRFRIELNGAIANASSLVKADGEEEEVTVVVRNSLPPVSACSGDRVVPFRLAVEAMINYRLDVSSEVSSRIDSIRIPVLELARASCREDVL